MMTMKEACEYKTRTRKERCRTHRIEVLKEHGKDGLIVGFSDKEYYMVKPHQKKQFNKGKKAAFNKIWRHYDLPKITKHT